MKSKYLLLPLALLLASCGPNESASISETYTPSDTSSTVNEADVELQILLNSSNPTSIRDSVTISKDGEACLSVFERIEYDSTNGIYLTYYQENGLSDLDNPNSSYNLQKTIYYDGYDSYTLDSDGMYIKKEESKEIVSLEIEFDFTLVEQLEFKKDGYRNVLEGVVSSANANKFLSLENKQISDIEFKSYSNGEALQSLEFVYTQNGFTVERTVDYTYVDLILELPAKTNIKKF
jgi:hypothetical protein